MAPVDANGARELLQAAVTAFSVMGGVMAYSSGFLAALAIATRQPANIVAHRVNQGIGWGFGMGTPAAVIALIIEGWT